jgi:CheY-like chemotaxis protein
MDVLIVDDDREAAHRLANFLAATGHTTRVAANGVEGLREMESDPPDVILLGVEMPLLDGPEMAEALVVRRAGKAAIPIVVMSASRHLEEIASTVGTPYFLKKPFAISQAIKMVRRARQTPSS